MLFSSGSRVTIPCTDTAELWVQILLLFCIFVAHSCSALSSKQVHCSVNTFPRNHVKTLERSIMSPLKCIELNYAIVLCACTTYCYQPFSLYLSLCVFVCGWCMVYFWDVLVCFSSMREWARREAERVIQKREKEGLPLIEENYYDPNKIVVPTHGES